MKIIDEILPKVKAGVRLDKDNKTLWIKTDTLEGYGRIIIEDGANWCRIFYEECGECAHNDAEQTEPTISKMEQVEEPQIDNLATAIAHEAYCKTCKHLFDEDCDCDVVFTGYEPKDEPQTDCAWR